MGFETQLEKLRLHLKKRIDADDFTVTEIAKRAGVSSTVISNFAHGKRGVKLKNADAIMRVLGLSDQFLLDRPRASYKRGEPIPVVRHTTAITVSLITRDLVLRQSDLTTDSFRKLPDTPTPEREAWTRFVAVVVTRSQAKFLHPAVSDSAILFIDRHDQQVQSNPGARSQLYAVKRDGYLGIGYIEFRERELILHPYAGVFLPMHIPLKNKQDASQLIVGSVCKTINNPPEMQLR